MSLPNEYAIRAYLARKEVLKPYFKEFQNLTKFSQYMGETNDNIIMVKRVTEGNTVLIPVNQIFYDMNIKRGLGETLVGAEQELTYDYMQFSVDRQRWAMKITDEQYQKLVFGRDFPEDIKRNLLAQAEHNLNRRIVQAFGTALTYQSTSTLITGNLGYVNYVWDWDTLKARMIACGLDQNGVNGDNVSKQRVVFGKDQTTAETTINNRLTNAGGVAANAMTAAQGNDFTISHIRKCIKLAETGNRPTSSVYRENPLRPFRDGGSRMGYQDSVYLFLISPSAYEYIVTTAEWQAQVSRGVIERDTQPSILWGSNYKGTIEGAMIVVLPEFDNYLLTGAAANSITYSVLVGAGAMAYGISGAPQLKYDERDYEHVRGIAHTEICGIRPIKFASKGDGALKGNQLNPIQVDNGIIHSFAAIA